MTNKMTREETIQVLRDWDGYFIGHGSDDVNEALDNAIKTLEQEPILDKIRAEIVDLTQRTMNDNRAGGMWTCIDIIDKYKIESEDEK